MHLACRNNNFTIVKKLIVKGADLVKKNNQNELPQGFRKDDEIIGFFKSAIKEGNIELVKALTKHYGEKLKEKLLTSMSGRTLHSYAKAKKQDDIANYLEAYGFIKQRTWTEYFGLAKPAIKTKNNKPDDILDSLEKGIVKEEVESSSQEPGKVKPQIEDVLDKLERGEFKVDTKDSKKTATKKSWSQYFGEMLYPQKSISNTDRSIEMPKPDKIRTYEDGKWASKINNNKKNSFVKGKGIY